MGIIFNDEYGDVNGNTIHSDNSNRDAAELAIDQSYDSFGQSLDRKKKNNFNNLKHKRNVNKRRRQVKNKSRYLSGRKKNSRNLDHESPPRTTSF